jgi:uracil-DNA glycosylase
MGDTKLEHRYSCIAELESEVIQCRKCPRLVAWREQVAQTKRRAYQSHEYWGKPVPAFGDPHARVLVVGLAPGAHGSNRTGRMFTGDASGNFLFPALFRAGFANQPQSHSLQDDLQLHDLLISAVCRCAPPDNKPTREEMSNCLPFLLAEMSLLPDLLVLVALGQIAFQNILAIYRQKGIETNQIEFRHAGYYPLGKNLPVLITSYHPSRQNTQTGRLTVEMFDQVWSLVKNALENGKAS